MKTFLKRRVAVLLMVCMICSMLPLNVWAAEGEETGIAVYDEEESTMEETEAVDQEQPETLYADASLQNVGVQVTDSSDEETENDLEGNVTALVASGACGDNLTWVLTENGMLTISGTGEMTSWNSDVEVIWSELRSSITSVVIEDGVTSIGAFAFASCSALANIEIPAGVTRIGYSAFLGCSSLASIKLPEEVTRIDSWAFRDCSSLTRIEIPEGVTRIEDRVFNSCSSLINVVLPDGVTSIGQWAFDGCSSLASIELPDGASISYRAFAECSSLTSITIPGGITSIGEYAFVGCGSLTDITIPEGVINIGIWAFKWCNKLTSVTLPVSLGSLSWSQFDGCTALMNIYYGGTEEKWNEITKGENVFTSASPTIHYVEDGEEITNSGSCGANLTWAVEDGTLTISGTGDMWDCEIPFLDIPWIEHRNSITSLVIEDGVTSIGRYTFPEFEKLTDVTIADSVKTIGAYAFTGCTGLTDINIPNGVEEIGYAAFQKCTGLTSVEIPASVTSIGDFLFRDCSNLSTVEIPEGILNISYGAFMGCSSLNAVTIPDGVTTIVYRAFSDCTGLTSVILPDSVNSIGVYAFSGCTALKDVYYGGSRTEWNDMVMHDGNDYLAMATIHYAGEDKVVDSGSCGENLTWVLTKDGTLTISGTGKMTEWSSCGNTPWKDYQSSVGRIVIEDGVTSIGKFAFSYFTKADNIAIPDSVTQIGECAFKGCWELSDIVIPNGVTEIVYGTFQECSSLIDVTIPDSVVSIGEAAFYRCGALKDIKLPDGVATIARDAFHNCGALTSVTLPEHLTSMGEYAFAYCGNLTDVVIQGELDTISAYSFTGCTSLNRVTIPSSISTIERYAFNMCELLADVCYDGTASAWNGITISEGNSSLTSAKLHFTDTDTSLAITTQPENQTGKIGDTVIFAVYANGEGLGCQWQYSKSGTYWYNSSSMGSTTNVLCVDVLAKRDGQMYRCVITDANGNSVTSDIVTLNVAKSQLEITSQPENQTGKIGDTVAFTVTASGEGLTYRWQYSKSGTYWYESGSAGSDTDTLSVDVLAKRDGQMYRCVITDATGNSVTSDVVTLNVAKSQLEITAQPENQTGKIGDTVAFTVTASGEGLTYRWQYSKSGTYWYESGSAGSDTDTLSVDVLAKRDGQMYRCVITDATGNSVTSEVATMNVSKSQLEITAQPENQTGKIGDTVAFTVTASGEGLTYRWQYSKSGTYWYESSSAGSNTDTLSVDVLAKRDGQMYRCVITNENGNTVTSDAAALIVIK